MRLLCVVALALLIPAEAFATVYYISPSGSDGAAGTSTGTAWKTFNKAFTTMSAGDTLNLMDGTYSVAAGTGVISYTGSNSAQAPSGTSVSAMTIIQAVNAGAAIVQGSASDIPLFVGRSFRKDSYIRFQGIAFKNDAQTVAHLYNTSHLTIKECSFRGAFVVGTNEHENGNTNNLIEDVWISANDIRVIAINYRADLNVWRRVLIRGDGCNEAGCAGSGNPNVGISVYDSSDVSLQNVIVLDRILDGGFPYADFACAQHTSGAHLFGRNEWLGTMSLASEDTGYTCEADFIISGGTHQTITNSIAWGMAAGANGFNVNSNMSIAWSNLTVKASGSGSGDAIRVSPSVVLGGSVTNIAVQGAGRYGINSIIQPTYCNVFGAVTANYNQTTCVTGATTVNAQADSPTSLEYILRVESDGATLHGTGASGADKGANIVKRYGVDGTRFGDAFYNTLTDVNLWPWPNQTRIFQEMCTDLGITRGFCGDTTLTHYIWNYLGNGSPYEAAQTVTVQTQQLPDLLVGQSCADTFTATGGNGSAFAWTLDSGTLPTGCSLSSSGNLTGTTTTEGTFNFTLEACDDESPTPNCDTEAFTKNISDPPSMDAFFDVGSTSIIVKSGLAGLDQSQSCTATLLYNAQTVDTDMRATGFASRSFTFSGLTPGQQYCIDVACGSVAVADRYCPTMLSSSTGAQTVPISFGAPFSGLASPARLTVEYDDNEALSSPAAEQDTNFGDGISVNLSLTAGLYWYRWKWQTAADVVLATSAVQPLVVP